MKSTLFQSSGIGHLFALITIIVWGVTFVETKVVLTAFTPIEVLFFRFALGYVALWAIMPHPMMVAQRKDELLFVIAGAMGVTLYFLMENIALTYTTASNVGIIVATAPLFTAIFLWVAARVSRQRKAQRATDPSNSQDNRECVFGEPTVSAMAMNMPLGSAAETPETPEISGTLEERRAEMFQLVRFLIGFVIAMAGIACASLTGDAAAFLHIAPFENAFGCLLALGAAIVWAVYNIFSKTISNHGYGVIGATRRIFFWGLLFMLPALAVVGFQPDWQALLRPEIGGNLLFLGLVASALCYVLWNKSISILGSVKTVTYLYLVPVVDVIASALVLGEPITPLIALGLGLAIAGLLISERN